MNRFPRPPPMGGSTKATASTLCQKCLKRGHYSYECKAVAQERPYVSRPSRTQQLLNPKLVPKLTSDMPNSLLRKKGVADEQLTKAELERGRKRERQSEEPENNGKTKRLRSASASSVSVSTISTRMSRSPSPSPAPAGPQSRSLSRSPPRVSGQNHRFAHSSRSPPRSSNMEEKKRRRDSYSSADSRLSTGDEHVLQSRELGSSRSTRRRFRHVSPPARGRRTESRSPQRGRGRFSDGREQVRGSRNDGPGRNGFHEKSLPARERSLSPFSKRLALTQAMSAGR